MQKLQADYLVVGCGAVSMAFVDTLLTESPDATIVIVDQRHMPGGHWNDAYPFVRLHQPSAFYGVASRELGTGRIDATGSNKGFYELATGAEVLAYFEQVMRERFLPSGRVQYFPMCQYQSEGCFESLLSAEQYEVDIAKRVVDGTFFNTSIPATHERRFAVDNDVTCVAPNELPRMAPHFKRYTVLGAGKTGMDAAVWLLDHGASPESITWVCPRDSWLINRSSMQPGGGQFFQLSVGGFAAQLEAMKDASSSDDLFVRLERAGAMLRIDPSVTPTMFHYATISQGEVDQLRRISNVVKQGRIASISASSMLTEKGESIPAERSTLYIDCTATAVQFKDAKTRPVFEDKKITLQALRAPIVTFSAAMAAFVEANFDSDVERNKLCTPVLLADNPAEYMVSFLGNMMNQKEWSQNQLIREWSKHCRLNPLGATVRDANRDDPEQMKCLERIRKSSEPAAMNLFKLITQVNA